jgi:MSHA biogenesis protein MshJ
MQQLIIKFEKHLDKLSKRDQIALLVIFIVVVLMIWFRLIYLPLSENIIDMEQEITQKTIDVEDIQAKMAALKKNMNEDPDAENRQLLSSYLEENTELDKALARTSVQIISPQEMSALLEQLLKSQPGLEFVSLKNKAATPEFIESRDELEAAVNNVNTIYRHSVVLQMEGSYHNALSYLKKLEQLPWRFFWHDVEIEASGYPNALITLEVYTLGFREGLIGV